MRVLLQGRVARTTSRYVEHAPMAAVCCNACRACATTNLAGLALAAAGGASLAVWTGAKRILGRRA